MTDWQWRVIMALVRYVLAKENDIIDSQDREILLEAAARYNK